MTIMERSIGKYRILEEIASGSFGRVYRGQNTARQNYPVAIKQMHAAHLPSAQERSSFMQEAHLLTMLRHPFIVPVLDVGIEDDFPYLVMEYAPNGSLYDRLKQLAPRPLPVKEALRILGQVGTALHYAHQQNVIHRDLKPANILFNAQGDALLADFGIATMLATSMKSGTAVGTPYYMAPEQFRGTISKEGDQYALGCIAYQIMTGRLPFDAPDFFSLGYKHMSEAAMPPTQLNLLIPYPVEEAILKAMAKQRTDRFPDVMAFVTALGAPVPALTIPSPSTPPTAPVTPPSGLQPEQIVDEEEDDEDHTLKRSRYVEEGGDEAIAPAATSPLSDAAREEEGQPGLVDGARDAAALAGSRAREEEGAPAAFADSLPRLVDMPTQIAAMPDVLPRLVEGAAARMPLPAGMAASAGRAVVEQEGAQAGRVTGAALEEEATLLAGPSVGARKRNPEEDPEGEDDAAPGYLEGAGTLIGARGATAWSLGTLPNLPPAPAKKRKRRAFVLIAAIIALVLMLAGGSTLYAMSGFWLHHTKPTPPAPPAARVTITPQRTALDQTYTIDAVTGNPNAAKNQVQARTISSSTGWQSKTIQATGNGSNPATKAYGSLTFWNDSSYAFSFAAYQVFTGSNGIQVVNEAGGTVPASPSPGTTWENMTVNAYTVQSGSGSNISKAAVNIWNSYYDGYAVIQNDSAFSGGSDGSSYTYISQGDMNNAAAAASQLQSSETTTAQSGVYGQVRANEKISGSVGCSTSKTYNGYAGKHANSVTASVAVSCSAGVYDQQGAQSLAASLLQTSVSNTPNQALAGQVTTSITSVSAGSHGTIILKVEAKGTSMYTFSNAQKLTLAQLIAGKTMKEAQDILVNQAGISKAVITVKGGDGHTLPKDVKRITILIAGTT